MANKIAGTHWSEADLLEAGVSITPEFIRRALENYWEIFTAGNVCHKKLYIQLDAAPYGSREGVLIGYFKNFSGLKSIHFAPANEDIGEPVRHIDILLRDKLRGHRLMSLEGRAISNGRTGWFAVVCLDLLLKGHNNIETFLIGSGYIAEAVILALQDGAAGRIKRIAVFCCSGKTHHKLVQKLRSKVGFTLEAVDDRILLPHAKFVVTATTNACQPVFGPHEISPNAVLLTLAIDEVPAGYFDRLLAEGGLLIGDDLAAMESRAVNSLALYYSRKKQSLTDHGRKEGVKNFAEVLADKSLIRAINS